MEIPTNEHYCTEQRFSNCGIRTTSGMRKTTWWYVEVSLN